MRTLTFIMALLISTAHAIATENIRYRGQYTYSHEVNIFCPAINSQCYWLSPETDSEARNQLKKLAANNTNKAYEAMCVVVEGSINRDPLAKNQIGFAEKYDGLFAATKVLGICDKTSIITQGDLQHHRWILESINGEKIDSVKLNNKIPEMDFGEQMTVSGNTGCNQFSARAVLRDKTFALGSMRSTRRFCAGVQNELESLLNRILSQESKINIDDKNNLILETGSTLLKYRLNDRVH